MSAVQQYIWICQRQRWHIFVEISGQQLAALARRRYKQTANERVAFMPAPAICTEMA
jgi:hypothetical protein